MATNGWSEEAIKKVTERIAGSKAAVSGSLVPTVKAKGKTKPRDRGMNKTEAEYSRYLATRQDVGWQAFEPIKFRLADNTSYCPDFMTMDHEGGIRFIDTKAWWASSKKVGVTEDSMVKMKVVAEMYPMFAFLMTWKKDGIWHERVF